MGCPIDEQDSSALSASPRRLTEGVLEDEVPTSADTGVTVTVRHPVPVPFPVL